MFDLLSWVPWVGGSSLVALALVALFAPSVLQVAAAWLSSLAPLFKGVAEGAVEVAKSLWVGFLDVTDNGKTILFVALVGALAFLWGYSKAPTKVVEKTVTRYEECSSSRHRVPPRPTKRPPPDPLSSWLDDIFGNP